MRNMLWGAVTALALTGSLLSSGCCGLNTAAPVTGDRTAGSPVINTYMDRQADEMTSYLESAAVVRRVGDGIQVTFSSGVLFGTGSADLTPEAQANIAKLAGVLNKYPNTDVNVEGHTDSDGSDTFNQGLSERRANSVAASLQNNRVAAARIHPAGYGETQPIATNDTPEGKTANRRVEIIVLADSRLRADAVRAVSP